ncbi:hypothetical protein [Haloarcula halophila]|uniref:hypothetical protein n=1 Tax=Haloarcula halophila TaxID=3032584 RepID=UPI0023E40560|nr:hypothetical protein [Halomicroarcula sp. DFY41]
MSAHETYADHELSFTDATTVVLVEQHDIDAVPSFDDDFDGIVDRLEPTAVADREPFAAHSSPRISSRLPSRGQ